MYNYTQTTNLHVKLHSDSFKPDCHIFIFLGKSPVTVYLSAENKWRDAVDDLAKYSSI